ncbi:MAG: hypothetical protein CL489_03470 [Acidobacteria bacterium]|nr:hypothetical protein [Acidobacteriota bacterium]
MWIIYQKNMMSLIKEKAVGVWELLCNFMSLVMCVFYNCLIFLVSHKKRKVRWMSTRFGMELMFVYYLKKNNGYSLIEILKEWKDLKNKLKTPVLPSVHFRTKKEKQMYTLKRWIGLGISRKRVHKVSDTMYPLY